MVKKRGNIKLLWGIVIAFFVIVVISIGYFTNQLRLRRSELVDTILMNPKTTSVVTYTVDGQGELVNDGYEIFFNADTPLVTASTMKVIVLAAYESAVAKGEMDPNEQVAIANLERNYLPKTDGNAHINGLASLGIKTDELGFALDQETTITLDDIARIMIHYSGNTETDYLLERLGIDEVNSIQGMGQHTPIRPILGAALAMINHEHPILDANQRQILIKEIEQGDYQYFDNLVDLYLNDQDWRSKQIEFMKSGEYINSFTQVGWEGQVEASQFLPKGTARRYANIMAKIASGQFISKIVSEKMQQKLESIPGDWPVRLLYCQRFGDKGGLTAGLINLVSYCVPKSGPLAGKERVVVIFTNELPAQTWSAQVQYEGVYFLQADLARATGEFSRLVNLR